MNIKYLVIIGLLLFPFSENAVSSYDDTETELSQSGASSKLVCMAAHRIDRALFAHENLHPKPFHFMRHAITDWNKMNLYMGSKDVSINSEGRIQAESVARLLEREHIEYIVTGPLSRTATTAEILARKLNKQLVVMDEFKQCCWGCKEGASFDDGTMIKRWLMGETPDGAETVLAFDARILRGLKAVFDLPGPTLIISHGGVYRSILRITGSTSNNIEHCVPYYHNPPARPGESWAINSLSDVADNRDAGALLIRKKHRTSELVCSPRDLTEGANQTEVCM